MIWSLSVYLLNIFYAGDYGTRIAYLLFMFTMGQVALARLVIQESRTYAVGYSFALAVVMIGVTYYLTGALAIAVLLVGVIAFMADRIVHDCTLIDDKVDASGEGLIDRGRREASEVHESMVKDPNAKSVPSTVKLSNSEQRRRTASQPGRTVFWLALAALPLFALGSFVGGGTADRVSASRLMLLLYLFSSLSLLVTTSFLNLRRYLRQRTVEMPFNVSVAWVGSGLGMIALLLLIASALPMPGRLLAGSLQFDLFSDQEHQASRFGWGNEAAQRSDSADAQTDRDDSTDGKEQQGTQSTTQSPESKAGGNQPGEKGSGGAKGGGKSGSSSGKTAKGKQQGSSSGQSGKTQQGQSSQSNQKSSSGSQQKGSQSEASAQQKSSQKSSLPQERSSRSNSTSQGSSESKANKPSGQESRSSEQTQSKQGQSDDQPSNPDRQGDSGRSQDDGSQGQSGEQQQGDRLRDNANDSEAEGETRSAAQQGSSLQLPQMSSLFAGLLKLLVFLGLLAVVAVYLYQHADWLKKWLADWMGRPTPETPSEESLPKLIEQPPKPFAAYQNPIGRVDDPRKVVVITFQAFDAWAREHSAARRLDETPGEFVRRLKRQQTPLVAPCLAASSRLADSYDRIVFGQGAAAQSDLGDAESMWQHMNHHRPAATPTPALV